MVNMGPYIDDPVKLDLLTGSRYARRRAATILRRRGEDPAQVVLDHERMLRGYWQ